MTANKKKFLQTGTGERGWHQRTLLIADRSGKADRLYRGADGDSKGIECVIGRCPGPEEPAILNLEHLSQQKCWLSARLGFDTLVPRYSTSAGRIETKFLRSYLELLLR